MSTYSLFQPGVWLEPPVRDQRRVLALGEVQDGLTISRVETPRAAQAVLDPAQASGPAARQRVEEVDDSPARTSQRAR